MNKKLFITGLSLILIACALVRWYYFNPNDNRIVKKSLLGKTSYSYPCTLGEDIVTNDMKKEQDDGKKEFSVGNIQEGDYKNAISDDELNDLLKIITEYYQNKLSWELVDYRIADNDHSFYQLYKDYELGNIIVFEVHTTNNPSGLYRAIGLGRKKNSTNWEILNEGV